LSKLPESEQSGSTIGEQLFQLVAEQLARSTPFAGAHPVDVAAQRVDLAVVAHEAVRLRAVPLGNVFVENREWTIARWTFLRSTF
jgi:hypothetical protein